MKTLLNKGWLVLLLLGIHSSILAQVDTLCNPNENKTIFGEAFLTYGGVSNAFNTFNRSDFTVGQAVVTESNMLSQDFQIGLGQWSPWLLPPQPPNLIASQGDFKDRVKLSWQVNPLSPAPTAFVVYRDGSYLDEIGADVRQYLDFNVQAGEFYEYGVVAKSSFGEGAQFNYVGFVNPNGLVSGKIESNSGNPVPGVEVRLTPLTGSSLLFDGVDDQLCITYNDKFPTQSFTVQAYIKLGDSNDESGIIDWGSGINANWWISTTSTAEGRGYSFHIGNGTGSDSIKYVIPVNSTDLLDNDLKWHQVSMVYNGTAMSVFIDGQFIGTKPTQINRVKQKLNIGSLNTGAFFKGNLDDVRIFNRPLTQTEIQKTKNRTVSQTEKGLIAYWKMDEGVGQKVFDLSNQPTIANIYGGATFSDEKPEVYSSGVSDVTGYYIIDGINYSSEESFRAEAIKNFEYNTALEFSAADKAYGDLTDFDIPDTATIEILFHPFDLNSRQTVLSKGSLLELYINNQNLYLDLNGTLTDLGAIEAKYYHLVIVLDNYASSAKIYLEGELEATIGFSSPSDWSGVPWLIASNSSQVSGDFYTGLIDEFVVYKSEISQPVLQEHFVTGIPQDSTTALLYSYFDFNEGTDTKIYDYAAMGFGAEEPREGNIYKASWSSNVRRSETNPHEFEPNIRVVNLNASNTAVGNIDFRAVSTVNVSGYVRFSDTFCFVDSVEVLVNDQSFFPPIFTDSEGKWSADFEPGANIKLKAKYGDHLFTPGFNEFRKLQSPKAGIVFLDKTKRTIRGQVAGGLCKKSVIPAGARVVVKVATLDGCFEKTDTLRNPDGKYVFRDLPARAFRVSVVEHSNSIIYDFFQLQGGTEVDLRNSPEDTVDFTYFAPPVVEIQGVLANSCGVKNVGQNVLNSDIRVKVYEPYAGGNCYVDGFRLEINDPTTGIDIDTTLADTLGEFRYRFRPQIVNLIPPYSQTISFKATADSSGTRQATENEQVVVLGARQRQNTFTSSTPEVPRIILRDPPGDASYSVINEGYTTCGSRTVSGRKTLTQDVFLTISVGGTSSVGIGKEIETTNKVTAGASFSSEENWTNSTTYESCLTVNRNISTSSTDQVVGSKAGGDVYIGTSENVTYGTADILNYNALDCSYELSQILTIDDIRLNNDFVYSEKFILEDVIPSLELLGSEILNPKKREDSLAAIKWREYVTLNQNDKGNELIKNISFDAGASFEETLGNENTVSWTDNFEFNVGGAISAGVELDFLGGFEAGLEIGFEHSESIEISDVGTSVTNITYHLEDDDSGDNFFVGIYRGKRWQTPMFELIAGESSCPWELDTRQRAEPSLISVDGTNQVNVPANTSAVFEVSLGNLSPTEEEATYELSVVTGTNPDGAIVQVDGQNLLNPIAYTVPYGESTNVLITIEKGPIAFDYEDITIQFTSACESVDSLFTKELSFDVSFIEPCSPVDIGFPLQDFVVTPGAENILSITLNEYNKDDEDLNLIRIQYRPIGGDGSWINISETPKAELGDVFTIKSWETELLQDGNYEIRAVAECTNINLEPGISTVVKGKLERLAPELVGVPEPGDGIWDPGDEISITFNEALNCDVIIKADVLSNNTIGLYDATADALVDAMISCVGSKITIVPNINPADFENRTFRVQLSGVDYDEDLLRTNPNHQRAALRDLAGNMIPESISWEFFINQNNLEWVGTDIIESNTVLTPFSVSRQVRNRGGTITNFRMEDVPDWLTITPTTGTLNPGQVADVTFEFQQDLLIGDYYETVNMVGSKGAEPMLIDYRVRCEAPVWEVENPAAFESTMNMVVDLNIFGDISQDPSDRIIAKIDDEIRGVGEIDYFRDLPSNKWLAFITIYGNDTDIGKPISFVVWDGDACNEYVEILGEFYFESGSLQGSPLEPEHIQVLNLVQKCQALNRGWNWVSFNLDLGEGNNTVTNMLASLETPSGAFIKDDELFAKYYDEPLNAWRHTLKTIVPEKRYLLYSAQRDTVCIKGSPYEAENHTLDIIEGWNWIGYVPSTGMTVNQALKDLTPLNGDVIKSQSSFAQYVAGIGWIGNLSFMEPFKGYLLRISNSGSLTYTQNGSNLRAGRLQKSETENQSDSEVSEAYAQYQSTMNLIGQVNGIEIEPEDELRTYFKDQLIGNNKPLNVDGQMLFFETIHFEDRSVLDFVLYKADRKKEYRLENKIVFSPDSLAGLVQDPVMFKLNEIFSVPVSIFIPNQVIQVPETDFDDIDIAVNVTDLEANCTSFAFNTITPVGNESAPVCSSPGGFEGNMNATVKVMFNELSSFVQDGDVLSFHNPADSGVVGCGIFDSELGLFDVTIGGTATSSETSLLAKYFSSQMGKSFWTKEVFTYKNNKVVGDYSTPHPLDFSPISVSADANGLITVTLIDSTWTGEYCLDAFAMNCEGYNDGETSFCLKRLGVNDCFELITRTGSEETSATFRSFNIESDASLNPGINVEYSGGKSITLSPGFEAGSNTVFKATIEGCPNE